MIKTRDENPDGLHTRYVVNKLDGTPTDENAEYFVLRLDNGGSDSNHINACRKAVLTYADEIAPFIPQLAEDLRSKYGDELCNCGNPSELIDAHFINMEEMVGFCRDCGGKVE